ncbi:MAG TPA: NAD(P)H:quinone oxidoreductase [Candidatus Binatia bacterium]|nr:NAD(P)H:quinone oxidoreductase [Candidatus Binatia bacterium]
MAKIAIVYYSAYGHTYELARAVEEGAQSAGAETRLRKVRELAPDEVIATQKGWHDHRVATQHVPEATLDDLEWADAFAFGTPTRFGGPAAQLKQFLDTTGSLWQKGSLADKAVTSFSGAMNAHGGQESTILALNNVFYHWGSIIVPIGYTDPVVFAAGGNPYGTSNTASSDSVDEATLQCARYQGARLARFAALLAG